MRRRWQVRYAPRTFQDDRRWRKHIPYSSLLFLFLFAWIILLCLYLSSDQNSGYGRVHAMDGKRDKLGPDFIIIGTWKSGTTSLHHYLERNPEICMAPVEVNYFSVPSHRPGQQRPKKGNLQWYRDTFFSHCNESLIIGEKSPSYLWGRKVPEKVRRNYPNVKLVVLLRNPVDRLHSHWWMDICKGRYNITLEQYVKQVESKYRSGFYAEQLKRWFKYFPREHFLFLSSEEFFDDNKRVLSQILNFVGSSPNMKWYDDIPEAKKKVWGSSPVCERLKGARPPMDPSTRRRLENMYWGSNERLERMTNRKFGWNPPRSWIVKDYLDNSLPWFLW